MDKIKVLYPYTGYTLGGSYVSSSLIIENLDDDYVKPVVYFPDRNNNIELYPRIASYVKYYNVKKHDLEVLQSPSNWKKKLLSAKAYMILFVKSILILRFEKPDIVHVNDDKTMLIWGLAARLLKLKLIWHVRQRKGNYLSDYIRYKMSSYIIYITCDCKKTRNRYKIKRPEKVVYNGVDSTAFYPPENKSKIKEELNLPVDSIVVGFVGNFVDRKRPEWLVEAGIKLLKEGIKVSFFMVGSDYTDGAYEDKLKKQVSYSGFERDFHFTGRRTDIERIMRALDILTLPSLNEPFGRVVIEAMASGTTVIATDGGGVSDIINNNKNGMLVSSFDEFVIGIRKLILNLDFRDRLAMNALVDVKKRFSIEKMVADILDVYDEVMK